MSLVTIILILAIGIVALVLELFIPSGGLLSLISAGALITAIVSGYVQHGFFVGNCLLLVVIVTVPFVLVIGFKLLPRSPLVRWLSLDYTESKEDGYHAAEDDAPSLVGREGVAFTPLRPSGIARIGDRRVDVVSEGGMIEKGTKIVVSRVEGNRIIVKKIPEQGGA